MERQTTAKTKVLVIDDSELVLDAVRLVLEVGGYEVVCQSSPFGTSAAVARVRPELVLLDVSMPGLGGVDIAKLLRATDAGRRACIVLHSGRPAAELEVAAAQSGADGYLVKGLDDAVFLNRLEDFLAKHRGG
ncbi:MAG: response regulator [Myxococcota bacterium]